MSLEDWEGFERILTGQKNTEWIHMTSQETPEYLKTHEKHCYTAENLEPENYEK